MKTKTTASQPPEALVEERRPDVSSKLKIIHGRSITQKHIEEAIAIDRLYYPDEFCGDLSSCLRWSMTEPDIYTMIVDRSIDAVIGYFNAMPINDDYFERIATGTYVDMQLPVEAIRRYEFPGVFKMYFSSIAIHPDHSSSPASAKALYEGFMDKLLYLAESGFYISEMLADALTPKGEDLAKRFGMRKLRESSHNSSIYSLKMLPASDFQATNKKASQVLSCYRKYWDLIKKVDRNP